MICMSWIENGNYFSPKKKKNLYRKLCGTSRKPKHKKKLSKLPTIHLYSRQHRSISLFISVTVHGIMYFIASSGIFCWNKNVVYCCQIVNCSWKKLYDIYILSFLLIPKKLLIFFLYLMKNDNFCNKFLQCLCIWKIPEKRSKQKENYSVD